MVPSPLPAYFYIVGLPCSVSKSVQLYAETVPGYIMATGHISSIKHSNHAMININVGLSLCIYEHTHIWLSETALANASTPSPWVTRICNENSWGVLTNQRPRDIQLLSF